MSRLCLDRVRVRCLKLTLTMNEARKAMTGQCLGRYVQSADFMAETTEQSFAVPEALAFYIGYHARKAVNFCATY